jgi:hypothetical protein
VDAGVNPDALWLPVAASSPADTGVNLGALWVLLQRVTTEVEVLGTVSRAGSAVLSVLVLGFLSEMGCGVEMAVERGLCVLLCGLPLLVVHGPGSVLRLVVVLVDQDMEPFLLELVEASVVPQAAEAVVPKGHTVSLSLREQW